MGPSFCFFSAAGRLSLGPVISVLCRLSMLDVVQVVWKKRVRDKQDRDDDLTEKEVGSCL